MRRWSLQMCKESDVARISFKSACGGAPFLQIGWSMPRLSCLFLANLALTFSLTPFLSGWEPAAIPRKPVLSVGIDIAPSGNLKHSFCASIAVIA